MSKTEFTAKEFEALGEGTVSWRFLLFPLVSVVGYVGFISGVGGDSLIARLAWSVFLGVCWACVAGSFHEAVHQTIGRWRNANIWFGRIVGSFLFIPYSAYRETHIRHHAYMNTADDFELWPYSKPGTSLAFRRTFAILNLLLAVVSEPIVYGRIYFKRKNCPLSAAARRTIGREYLGAVAFWGTVILVAIALTMTGTIDWRRFDPMWLLPMQIAATINVFRKFVEHLGMESTEPFLGTRTIIGNNPVTRLCSYFNFELDVHGPHHRYPKAPHFELESKLIEFRQKHPDAKVPVFSTYLAAALDTLPCIWLNPGVGQNAARPGTISLAGSDAVNHDSLLPPGIDNFTSEVTSPIDRELNAAA